MNNEICINDKGELHNTAWVGSTAQQLWAPLESMDTEAES